MFCLKQQQQSFKTNHHTWIIGLLPALPFPYWMRQYYQIPFGERVLEAFFGRIFLNKADITCILNSHQIPYRPMCTFFYWLHPESRNNSLSLKQKHLIVRSIPFFPSFHWTYNIKISNLLLKALITSCVHSNIKKCLPLWTSNRPPVATKRDRIIVLWTPPQQWQDTVVCKIS